MSKATDVIENASDDAAVLGVSIDDAIKYCANHEQIAHRLRLAADHAETAKLFLHGALSLAKGLDKATKT